MRAWLYVSALCLVVSQAVHAGPVELALFIWPDYIDRDVLTAFHRETGITVH